MQVIQITVTETPHAPRVGRMGRRGRGGHAFAETEPMHAPRMGRMGRHGHGRRPIAKTKPVHAARAVRRVLKDRPLSPGQQALLKALYDAGDAGLTTTELTVQLDRDKQRLNRLLGRLARRIRRTPGARVLQRPGITLLFDITSAEGEWRYKLRPVTRKVLDAQGTGWLPEMGSPEDETEPHA